MFDGGARAWTRVVVEECRNRDDGPRLNPIHIFRPYLSLAGCWFGRQGKKYIRAPVGTSGRRGMIFYSRWSLQTKHLTLETVVEHSAVPHSPRPSLSRAAVPCSNQSSRDIQNSFLPFIISANTAPPKKTMCFRRGGSSILILNFCERPVS